MAIEEITYRQLMEKDAEELKKLFPKNKIKNFNSGKTKRFIAVSQKKIIAHIQADYSENPYSHIAELKSLIVLPEYRGRGTGQALYEHALGHLGKRIEIAIARVRTTNIPSIKIHEKLGFRVAGKLEKGYKSKTEQKDIYFFAKQLQ